MPCRPENCRLFALAEDQWWRRLELAGFFAGHFAKGVTEWEGAVRIHILLLPQEHVIFFRRHEPRQQPSRDQRWRGGAAIAAHEQKLRCTVRVRQRLCSQQL